MTLFISLITAGVLLVIAEFFLPGMIAGAVGVVCLLAGTAVAFQQFGTAIGFYILIGEIIFGLLAFVLWVRYFPASKLGKIFSLKETTPPQYSSSAYEQLANKTGKAISDLRPSGVALIDGQRYDVVSEGAFIEEGADIKVVKVEGARMVVRSV